nr:hypothetical protein [Tanacetum cinerariifolium]
ITLETVSTARPDISAARPEVSTAEPKTPPITITLFDDEDVSITDTLVKISITLQPLPTINLKDKGKSVLVEEEPEKLQIVKRRDKGLAQIKSDADLAQRIYEEELAELDRAQKERQKQEEMTHEEQEMYTIKERARLLAEYFERRKKQLAVKAIRNKPPTRTQVRNRMITYLKHMDDFVPTDSKKEEKKLVEPESKDKTIKRVADSTPKQKSSKKQKMMQEQESVKSDEEESADYDKK